MLAQIDEALKIGAQYGLPAFLLVGLAAFTGHLVLTIVNRHAKIMESNSETLVKLQAIADNQQTLCTGHSVAIQALGNSAAPMQELSRTWGHVNPSEYRVEPAIDSLLHIVDTAAVVSNKCGCNCNEELMALKMKIAEQKSNLTSDRSKHDA